MTRTFPEALPNIALVAAALGDPSRAAMSMALMDGRAWTATELRTYTGLGAPTVSKHIDKLISAGIVVELRQGRHRYIALASDDVARAIESLGVVAAAPVRTPPSLRASRRNDHIRAGRTCYKHLAGQLGVGLTDQLRAHEYLASDWRLTDAGIGLLSSWGMHDPGRRGGIDCLDSTERRFHLSGDLGKSLCSFLFDDASIERIGTSRAVRLTDRGRRRLAGADLLPMVG